jgi:NADH:ubiquinone oxidoreductase subunit K
MMTLDVSLIGAFALIAVGLFCLATNRNMIMMVIGVEIMMNGSILALVGLATNPETGLLDPLPQSLAIMAIAIGGSVSAVGLVMITQVYRHYKTLDVRELKKLRL